MQRALTIAFALAAVALSAVLAFKSAADAPAPVSAAPNVSSLVDAASDAAASDAAGARADAGDDDASLFALTAPLDVPRLSAGAPREVRFGVILVTYEGAQGAPAHARSKREALGLAQKLAEDAKSDFKAAVARGDAGSSEDAGSVPRGVLEPAPEAALFALPVGGTSGVVDTPRGFWIVKRLE